MLNRMLISSAVVEALASDERKLRGGAWGIFFARPTEENRDVTPRDANQRSEAVSARFRRGVLGGRASL
jgi:hypothetical protein